MTNTITLKEKLKTLGFEETYSHGQYFNRDLDLYVYIRYNKIKCIQISKAWESSDFNKYSLYLSYVYGVLEKLEKILNNKGE